MSRCVGQCCKRFFVPLTPDDLETGRQVLASDPCAERFVDASGCTRYFDDDLAKILDMLVFIESSGDKDAHGAFYTCKHLAANGDCQIYDQRPRMCSAYPYGLECRFPGCAFEQPEDLSKATSMKGKPLSKEEIL